MVNYQRISYPHPRCEAHRKPIGSERARSSKSLILVECSKGLGFLEASLGGSRPLAPVLDWSRGLRSCSQPGPILDALTPRGIPAQVQGGGLRG